jgi:ABC-type sugar transport system ATPase subunit
MGAGRTEVVRAISGADKMSEGEIFINGEPVKIRAPNGNLRFPLGVIPLLSLALPCGNLFPLISGR